MKSIKFFTLFFLFSFSLVKSQVYTKGFQYNQFVDTSSGGGGVTLKIENNILTISYNFGVSSSPLKLGKVLNFSDYTGSISNTEIPVNSYFQDKGYRFFVIGKDIAIYPVAPQHVSGSLSGTLSVNLTNPIPINADILNFFSTNYTYDNKILSTDYLDETQTSKKSSIIYFDGLGREKQQVLVGATPTGKDLVTHIEYDGFGRQAKSFLPFPSANTTGALVSGAATATTTFYNAVNSPTKATEQDTFPYSEKQFDGSPLNRVLKQSAPGNSWKLGSNNEIKFEYNTNTATEVRKFLVTLAFDTTNKIYNPTLTESGTYPANSLYKIITKDENWKDSPPLGGGAGGGVTEEFKNKEGQTLLKRTYNGGVAHNTYYVYDDYGNQTYIIPPKLADETSIVNLNSKLSELGYQYKYDHRNRMIEKKLPGKTAEFMVYDKLNRLVMTGPALAPFTDLTTQGWLVTKYDRFNRPVYTAWMQDTTINASRRNVLQAEYNKTTTLLNENKLTTNTTFVGVTHRYSSVVYPTSGYRILTVNYYDNYDFPNAFARPTAIEGQTTRTQLTAMPTGSWVRVLEQAAPTTARGETTTLFYDNKARNIGTYLLNYLGGFTYTTQKLDFRGKPTYTITKHKRLSTNTELTVREDFTYDSQERLKKHTHQINGGSIETLVQNEYDEIGQLKTKHVGGIQTTSTGTGALQKADYLYNIRGWLRKLNEPSTLGSDLFGYELRYQNPSELVSGLFNGNISQSFWKTSSDGILRSYVYRYDNLNRMISAWSKDHLGRDRFNESLSYDKNGNILTLNRTGANSSNASPLTIDWLFYTYDNGNKLLRVTDASLKNEGFTEPENQETTNDYTYDTFGNLTSDNNKKITNIRYNHLNLPLQIDVADWVSGVPNGAGISYLYRADGLKLRKMVTDLSSNKRYYTDYLTGFQYGYDEWLFGGTSLVVLSFFPHKEGYVNNRAVYTNPWDSKPSSYVYEYIYNHTDHLGNVRLSYRKNGTSTQIIEENNYYPFGLKHKGYNDNSYGTAYKYKYNGKEFQDELNLNVYDFSARVFDPASVVAWQHDPLSEKTLTPYSLFYGNPVKYNDPTGMSPNDWFWNSSTQRVEWRNSDATELKEGNNTLVNVGDNKSEVMKEFGIPRGASINENDTSFTLNFEEKTVYNLKGSELTKGGFIIPQGSHDGKISLSYTNELTTKREDGVTFIDGVKTTVRQTYHYNDQAGKVSDKSLFYSEYQIFNNTTQSSSKVFSKIGLDLSPSINNFHGENFKPLNFQSFTTTSPFSKDFKNENITIRATMGATDGNKSFRITNYLRINK